MHHLAVENNGQCKKCNFPNNSVSLVGWSVHRSVCHYFQGRRGSYTSMLPKEKFLSWNSLLGLLTRRVNPNQATQLPTWLLNRENVSLFYILFRYLHRYFNSTFNYYTYNIYMYECTIFIQPFLEVCHYFLKGRQVSLHMLLSEHLFFVLVDHPVFVIKLVYSTEYNSSYRSYSLKIYLIWEYGGGGKDGK